MNLHFLTFKRTIQHFRQITRFSHVESRVKTVHGGWGAGGEENLPLAVLDTYWEEAKAAEKAKR